MVLYKEGKYAHAPLLLSFLGPQFFRVWIPERADLYRTSFAERAGIDDQLGRGRKYGRRVSLSGSRSVGAGANSGSADWLGLLNWPVMAKRGGSALLQITDNSPSIKG